MVRTDVDVIVPCYNYARYLRGCVDSVLSQSGVRVRVLIIDDASKDDSAEVAADLARQDERVEVAVHEANRGHVATYNEGLAWMSGECALLLSADDLLLPGALRRAVTIMSDHPAVSLVHGRQILFSGDAPSGADLPVAADLRCEVESGSNFIRRVCAQAHNHVATPTAVVRTAVQRRVGGYRRELPHTNDMDMWLRLAAHGDVGIVHADQALKRRHDANMQLAFVDSVRDLEQRLAALDMFFAAHGHEIDGSGPLRALAHERLAIDALWSASHAFDRGDASASGELRAFAARLQPDLMRSAAWSRLTWKRRMGVRAWAAVRPLVDGLRGMSAV